MTEALNIGLALVILALAVWTVVARDTFSAVVGFVAYGCCSRWSGCSCAASTSR